MCTSCSARHRHLGQGHHKLANPTRLAKAGFWTHELALDERGKKGTDVQTTSHAWAKQWVDRNITVRALAKYKTQIRIQINKLAYGCKVGSTNTHTNANAKVKLQVRVGHMNTIADYLQSLPSRHASGCNWLLPFCKHTSCISARSKEPPYQLDQPEYKYKWRLKSELEIRTRVKKLS